MYCDAYGHSVCSMPGVHSRLKVHLKHNQLVAAW